MRTMKTFGMSLAASVVSIGVTFGVSAQGLEMEFCVVQLPSGLYEYECTISTDAGWAPGMGWHWVVFADEPNVAGGGTGFEPLPDFVVQPTSFPVGPWEKIQGTGGGHNGRTFAKLNGAVLDFWIPADENEVLTWIGTSAFELTAGEMLFSTLAGTTGGATAANFNVATLVCDACYADCDGSGVLNILDYICFGDDFAAGGLYADCDGNGSLNILDYICFGDAFAVGCP